MSKKYVVLDLFVIYAIESKDLDLYFNTGRILQLIKQKCHKIVLTPPLKKEYMSRLKNLEKGVFTNDRLFKYLKLILANSEKIDEEPEPPYNLRISIPQDDLPIVKTALTKGRSSTIIITTNRKHFIENEELKKFLESNNIKVLPPEEAIHELNRD